MTPLDLTGQIFGQRRVLSFVRSGGKGIGRIWKVQCACGREDEVQGQNLTSGHANRCLDCSQKRAIAWGKARITHGCSRALDGTPTPEYKTWCSMRTRCANPRNPHYADYGGRGIQVCTRWTGKNGFENFLADMGRRPSPAYSLDRFPNNDGNYEPTNCRWATHSEQTLNRRKYQAIENYSTVVLLAELQRRGIKWLPLQTN